MWAVHLLTKAIPAGEYGGFGALLTVVMLLPTIPLQMVIAQQTAKALATNQDQELSGVLRWFFGATFLLWLVFAAAVLFFQGWILQQWKLPSASGLWLLVPIVLFQLWLPLFWGALQGKQNFLWLGWSMMLNGVGRLTAAALAVLVLHIYSTGMIAGVLIGLLAATAIAVWHTRSLWRARPKSFDWRSLLGQVSPLLLGFCGFQILFTADTLFVKAYFSGASTDFYLSAGTLSRALMWLVGPMAAVMFPRLVQSAAKSEKFDLMRLVLVGTAVLSATGAAGLALLGPWVVKLVYTKDYVPVASAILPWYAGAMVPLSVANVLLNNLLARPSSNALPAICVFVLAVAYAFALTQFHSSLVVVLQTLGVFNLLLLGVCAWFTWGAKTKAKIENGT
jgi:O-antigen/teichoic acid export membrane protein